MLYNSEYFYEAFWEADEGVTLYEYKLNYSAGQDVAKAEREQSLYLGDIKPVNIAVTDTFVYCVATTSTNMLYYIGKWITERFIHSPFSLRFIRRLLWL